jgi:hypothetical protein
MNMSQTPRERLSQRQLSYELRIAIDRARNASTKAQHAAALKEVHRLVKENPEGTFSRYVTHNIGNARTLWLTSFVVKDESAHARAAMSLHSNLTR